MDAESIDFSAMEDMFARFKNEQIPLIRLWRSGRIIARAKRIRLKQYFDGHYSGAMVRLPSGAEVKLLIERRTKANLDVSDVGLQAWQSRAVDQIALPKTSMPLSRVPMLIAETKTVLGILPCEIVSDFVRDFPRDFPRDRCDMKQPA